MNFEDYLKLNCEAKNTRRNYLGQVKQFLSVFPELNQENLDKYMIQKDDEEVSKSTYNVILSALKCYTKYLKIELEFPKERFIGKKISSYVTKNELEDIFPYFAMIFKKADYYKFLILFLFYTGLRPKELINLKTDDICFDKTMIIVRNPKDKDDRYTPYPKEFQEEIKKWMNKSGKAFDINYNKIQRIFKKINEKLGYRKHLTAYSLRHGFAKYILRQGYSLIDLKNFMGHSDIRITMIYADITPKESIEKWIEREK